MKPIPDEIKKEIIPGMRPLGSNVYIYILPRIKKLGLVEMPEQHREYTEKAMVIAIADGVKELEIGDIILIPYHEGIHLQIEETYTESSLHRIIIEHNILSAVD